GREHGLEVKRPYDAFGLYTHFEHRGDFSKATEALEHAEWEEFVAPYRTAAVIVVAADEPPDPIEYLTPGRWDATWKNEKSDEILVGPMLVEHRHHLLYAPRKSMKSLLVLWILAALACGRAVLDRGESAPIDVLAIDLENDLFADVRERLTEMGYVPDD